MKFSASSAETPGSSWPHGCSGKAPPHQSLCYARQREGGGPSSSGIWWWTCFGCVFLYFFNPSPYWDWVPGRSLRISLTIRRRASWHRFHLNPRPVTCQGEIWISFCTKGLIKLDKSRQFQNMYLNYTWKYAAPIRQKRFKTTKWRQIVLKILWRCRWVVDNPMFFYKTQILNFRRFCFSQYS